MTKNRVYWRKHYLIRRLRRLGLVIETRDCRINLDHDFVMEGAVKRYADELVSSYGFVKQLCIC